VSRTATGLAPIASWEGYLGLVVSSPSEILVSAAPDTGRVSIAAQQARTLYVFTASDSDVEKGGEIDLSGQILSLDGHGDRVWACTRQFGLG
jgi:hypothetical protein